MELNPQAIIDEMSKRIHSLTMENIVLQAQVSQLGAELSKLVNAKQSADTPQPQ
jgi:hypothetical protein